MKVLSPKKNTWVTTTRNEGNVGCYGILYIKTIVARNTLNIVQIRCICFVSLASREIFKSRDGGLNHYLTIMPRESHKSHFVWVVCFGSESRVQ